MARNFHQEFANQVARASVPPEWTARADLVEYNGEWTDSIWECVRRLEQQCDKDGRITRADTNTSRKVDFVNETFAATADGLNRQLSVISSGRREAKLLDSDETHAERKILAAMSGQHIPIPDVDEHSDVLTLKPGRKAALYGGYTDVLFMFVTKSPCRTCSQALVDAMGPQGSGRFQKLVVAFLAFYSGPDRMRVETTDDWDRNVEKMPSEDFWQAMQGGDILLFKPVWNDYQQDQRTKKMQQKQHRLERIGEALRADTAYDHLVAGQFDGVIDVTVFDDETGKWLPAPEPDHLSLIGRGGRPVDPRYQVIQFRPR